LCFLFLSLSFAKVLALELVESLALSGFFCSFPSRLFLKCLAFGFFLLSLEPHLFSHFLIALRDRSPSFCLCPLLFSPSLQRLCESAISFKLATFAVGTLLLSVIDDLCFGKR